MQAGCKQVVPILFRPLRKNESEMSCLQTGTQESNNVNLNF